MTEPPETGGGGEAPPRESPEPTAPHEGPWAPVPPAWVQPGPEPPATPMPPVPPGPPGQAPWGPPPEAPWGPPPGPPGPPGRSGWGPRTEAPWGASSPPGQPAPVGEDGFPSWGPGSLAPIPLRAVARLVDLLPMLAVFSVAALRYVDLSSGSSVDTSHIPLWLAPAAQLVDIVYETVAVGLWGKTVGKAIFGLRIEGPDGGRPGWWRAAVRVVVPDLAAMIPFIGSGLLAAVVYLTAVWSPVRQGIHDRAAGTVVVRDR